jgi:hypothetical protein
MAYCGVVVWKIVLARRVEEPVMGLRKTSSRPPTKWEQDLQNAGVGFKQDPGSMSPAQVDKAIAIIGPAGLGNEHGAWDWFQQLRKQQNANTAAARAEELQMAMAESYASMAEAANRVVPSVEPLKQAPEQYAAAQSDTARKQQMRSGLLSAFNRYGVGALRTNSLQNKAEKLGVA